ncbi:MAG: hypothetical protein R3Y26_05565 [Rikenellaceae bacterium]
MNLKILLPFMMLLIGCETFAQSLSQKAQERDVKISGNYYYGDGISDTENNAIKLALDDLKIMISEDMKEQNRDVSVIDFKGFEQDIGTIVMPVQNRVRVIAFVLKKEIKVESSGIKRLMVVRIMPGGVVTDTNSNLSSPPTQVKPSTQPKPSTNRPVVSQPVANTSSPIISELIKLTSSKEVGVLLNDNKSKGNLVYGKLNTIEDASKCYFVILRAGKLIDVLNLGSGTVRTGLISGNNIDYTHVSDIIYWVNIN